MLFSFIARYRARKSFISFGYDQKRNPYTPKTGCPNDLWSAWYWEHQSMHYKELKKINPNIDTEGSSFYEF